MQSPKLDLTSVYAKLSRAQEHFETVDLEINKWLSSGHYETFFERSPQETSLGIGLIRVGPPADLIRWSLIIGDCVNNLRSALDHLVVSLCKVPTLYASTAKKNRSTFVIVDTPELFRKARTGSLGGFSESFLDLLETFQPYRRTHPDLPPLLSVIRDLSNADKHRLLQVAGAGVASLEGIFQGDPGRGSKSFHINDKAIEHNEIIATIESSEPDPDLAIQSIEVSIEISIWHELRHGEDDPPTRTYRVFSLVEAASR